MQTETTAYKDNPFVAYLNSLQRIGGGNENALAEAQACNPNFSKIRQPHPLADKVYKYLQDETGSHVVLTGHAGDGKTTLALEIFKKLKGFEDNHLLRMQPREDVRNVTIIKDLSERDHGNDDSLFKELMSGDRRFLLVSNTGTLLSILKNNGPEFAENEIDIETAVLEGISSKEGGGQLELNGITFRLLNLAQIDNLSLARGIFERMLEKDNWEQCNDCSRCQTCPINKNIQLLIEHKERIVDRMFLLYRRLYEYGSRLTIRQLTEHMAYCLCSGNDCKDAREKNIAPQPLSLSFLNRFFGDDGYNKDTYAQSLRAIVELRKQSLGQHYSNAWERELWVKKTAIPFSGSFQDIFDALQKLGGSAPNPQEVPPAAARQQVRRALYFLYDFSNNHSLTKASKQEFMKSFLGSSYLLTWLNWQKENSLELQHEQRLKKGLFQVLQEHFSGGVRLPEGYHTPERLYITMANPEKRMRQASQIVTTELDWQQGFTFKLIEQEQINGHSRFDLQLCGIAELNGVNLLLSVPFLDFMAMRQRGEVGEGLDRSYIRRLDHFKTRLEKQKDGDPGRLLLVHIQNDGSFSRQSFQLNGDGTRLEVTNE